MPSKKKTYEKRQELKQKKNSSGLHSWLLPTIIVLIVIGIAAVAAITLLPGEKDIDDTGNNNGGNTNPPVENVAPMAVDDSYTRVAALIVNSQENFLKVIENDYDENEDELSIKFVEEVTGANITIVNDMLNFVPDTDFTGDLTFAYIIDDGTGNTSEANVTVSVVNRPNAVIDTAKGTIKVQLYTDLLPKTCANFIQLIDDGFYDGMIVHRVMDDFMIQAGTSYPDGSTQISPYGNIQFETHEDVKHVDGAISMASTGWAVGGSAQFFICDGEQHDTLDGGYAVFGVTVEGIEVVRDIADETHDFSSGQAGGGKPLSDILINSITIEYP